MEMPRSPFQHFSEVFALACQKVPKDANAMVVSSVNGDGRPSSRVVLLKEFDERGFVFYTNLTSRKGQEILAKPYVSLNFHWHELEQQVRIEGSVEQVTSAEADAYFATRPRLSQLGAWASLQSQPLASREVLETRVQECEKRYENQPVPRPPHWSGLRVVPDRIEFWIGRPNRLHDRFVYARPAGIWEIERLYP